MNKRILVITLLSLCVFSSLAKAEDYALSLDESVALALSRNEGIESSERARENTRHQLTAARRAAGLSVAWNTRANRIGGGHYKSLRRQYNPGTYDVYGEVIKSDDPYQNEFTNNITAQFPIYSGGQIEGRIKSAGFQSAAADLSLERTRQQVRFQTIKAYYDLLQRQNLLSVAENAVKTAQNQLKLIDIQYEEGAVPKADVLQMQVQLASYKQDYVTAQGALSVAMYQLARLTGLDGENIILKDKLSYEPFPFTLAQAETYAMARRPDRAAATFAVKQAQSQVDIAAAGYKPKVNASYTRNIADNRPFMRDGRTEMWSAGVDVSVNVFDNRVTTANVDAAKANVEKAKADEANVKKTLLLETSSAYAQMKSAETNIEAAKVAVEQAKESYEISTVRYEEGVDNLLAVTTAQERLMRAQTNYYTSLYNYNLYKAELERAVGYPVALNVPAYEEAVKNNPGSAKHLDKAEESAKLY